MLLMLFMSSCTKSDLEDGSGYNLVRLYDDTLPDPRNDAIHIAAADGRLLMTYGRTFSQILFVNGAATFPPPAENVWMLTDDEGNLIRRDLFLTGLSIGDVTSLPDNSFFVVMYTGIPNLWGGPEWTMQIMRIDPNGVMGPVSLLSIPTIHPPPYQSFYDILIRSVLNGNVLISFYYGGADGGSGSFVGEMNTQGSFLWHTEFDNRGVSGCVGTPDGGYMISGRWWDLNQNAGMYIMKTNSTFDSTWSRFMVPKTGTDGRVQVASAGNGNYWLNYVNSYNLTATSHLLEFNPAGEIVDSNFYMPDIAPYNINTVMLQHGSSGLYMSYTNSISNVNSIILEKFNSAYATFDGELNITKQSFFQQQTSDIINSGCRMKDGRIACFGLIQSYDRRYYKPELIIIN